MAAKASASAFNSFFYQQQQQEQQKHQQNPNVINKMDAGSLNSGGGIGGGGGEPVHDLHLKMSKKIAQLTKVDFLFSAYTFYTQ